MSEPDTAPDSETNGEAPEDEFQEILEDHLDPKDYQIFLALNDDGRMSDTELGEIVDLSRTAARRRRRNLQEAGVIDVLAVLVLQEANLAYADVRLTFSTDAAAADLESFVESILSESLIYEVDEYLGEYDLLLRIMHQSFHELKGYVAELLQGVDVVEEYDVAPVVKTRKAWNKVMVNGTRQPE